MEVMVYCNSCSAGGYILLGLRAYSRRRSTGGHSLIEVRVYWRVHWRSGSNGGHSLMKVRCTGGIASLGALEVID